MKYLFPKIARADLAPMLVYSIVGAMIAGVYGIIHDQLTFSIGPEYFTNLKFEQFHYADFGLGDRVFVACIGFLATWWVGLIVVWFLARRMIPDLPRPLARRKIITGTLITFVCAITGGLLGYGYGIYRGADADYSAWQSAIIQYRITDSWSFVRVAYIHNAGYLGGLIGFLSSLLFIRPLWAREHSESEFQSLNDGPGIVA